MNLLRAGKTQARARFASGAARGAARPARVLGRGGARCQKAPSGLCRRWERESEGVPGSAQEASVSAVSRARGAHCLGVLPGCGAASPRPQSRGAAGEPGKFAAGTALPGWRSHLWESLALGLSQLSRGPHDRGGRPPSPRGWGGAANQPEGTPDPLPLLSARARTCLSSGGGCFPFTARTPQ